MDCKVNEYESLGVFQLTHYCCCKKCCGKHSFEVTGKPNKTATGTYPEAGRTIAVDPKIIPYGTIVRIDGEDYVAEDCGGGVKGNQIDIYCDTHEEALQKGVKYKEVFILKKQP